VSEEPKFAKLFESFITGAMKIKSFLNTDKICQSLLVGNY